MRRHFCRSTHWTSLSFRLIRSAKICWHKLAMWWGKIFMISYSAGLRNCRKRKTNWLKILMKSKVQSQSCHISKRTQEIVYLLNGILDGACNWSDDNALKLFYTTKSNLEVLALFLKVALFHNNFWYLGHEILTLILKHNPRLSPAFQKNHSLLFFWSSYLLQSITVSGHQLYSLKYFHLFSAVVKPNLKTFFWFYIHIKKAKSLSKSFPLRTLFRKKSRG